MAENGARGHELLVLRMIFSENRFTLCANAALRVRIMRGTKKRRFPGGKRRLL